MAICKLDRKSLIKRAFDDAEKQWQDSDGDVSVYGAFDESIAEFDFPISYTSREDGDWDILTIAFLNEEGKIEFLSLTF